MNIGPSGGSAAGMEVDDAPSDQGDDAYSDFDDAAVEAEEQFDPGPGPTGDGVSDHAAVLYTHTPANGGRPLRVLVWNAQDWYDAAVETEANQVRGEALKGMLAEHDPDVVVLLETGQAGRPNKFVQEYVRQANEIAAKERAEHGLPPPVPYGGVTPLHRDNFTTHHDKGMAYFAKRGLPIEERPPSVLDSKERRPCLGLVVAGVPLAFLHAIAARSPAEQQIDSVLSYLRQTDQDPSLLAGDLNHEPSAAPAARPEPRFPRAARDAAMPPPKEPVRTGLPTHYSSSHPERPFSELDWAYSFPQRSVGTWNAQRITDRPGPNGSRIAVWKGVGVNARVAQARREAQARRFGALVAVAADARDAHLGDEEMKTGDDGPGDVGLDAAHALALLGAPPGIVLGSALGPGVPHIGQPGALQGSPGNNGAPTMGRGGPGSNGGSPNGGVKRVKRG